MKLNDLMPNEGRKKETENALASEFLRAADKTAGRGTKGEGARSGQGGSLYRQGGNLPFYRHLPFIRGEGFTPPFQVEYNEVNLTQLAGFKANAEITPATMADANLSARLQILLSSWDVVKSAYL